MGDGDAAAATGCYVDVVGADGGACDKLQRREEAEVVGGERVDAENNDGA